MPPPATPALRFAPELLLRAQGVRLVFFDIDGVFTDGSLYYGETGEALKRFHTLDGQGLKMLQHAGIEPAIITGRDSAALRARLSDLGLKHAALGVRDKLPEAQRICAALQLHWSQSAAVGDDWPDLPVLARAAFAAAPPQAHAEVLQRVHYVTQVPGGAGAVREVCDLILQAAGRYSAALQAYTS